MEIVNTELWNSLRNLTPRAAAAAAGKAWKQGNKLNDGSTNHYPWIRFSSPLLLMLFAWPVAAHENIIEYDPRERERETERGSEQEKNV